MRSRPSGSLSVTMASFASLGIVWLTSTSLPSTFPPSAALARPGPMEAATSPTVTGFSNCRTEPSGRVMATIVFLVIPGAAVAAMARDPIPEIKKRGRTALFISKRRADPPYGFPPENCVVGGLITGALSRRKSVRGHHNIGRLGLPPRGRGEDAGERGRIERLHEMAVESGVDGLAAVLLGAVAGERDDVGVGHAELPAHARGDLVPAQSRQADVHEDQVGLVLGGGPQRAGAFVRLARLLSEELEHHRERLRGVDIVVDDENALARRSLGARRRALRLDKHGVGAHGPRQADGERAALAQPVARRLDRSAVALHEIPHQRQADAQALADALGRFVDLDEEVPDLRELVPSDADAVVAHADHHVVELAFCGDLDAPLPFGVLGRVEDEVLEDLLQAHAVGDDPERLLRKLHDHLVPADLDLALAGLDRVANLVVDVERLAAQLDGPARDPRDIQQVLDQARHLRHLAGHRLG